MVIADEIAAIADDLVSVIVRAQWRSERDSEDTVAVYDAIVRLRRAETEVRGLQDSVPVVQ